MDHRGAELMFSIVMLFSEARALFTLVIYFKSLCTERCENRIAALVSLKPTGHVTVISGVYTVQMVDPCEYANPS